MLTAGTATTPFVQSQGGLMLTQGSLVADIALATGADLINLPIREERPVTSALA